MTPQSRLELFAIVSRELGPNALYSTVQGVTDRVAHWLEYELIHADRFEQKTTSGVVSVEGFV